MSLREHIAKLASEDPSVRIEAAAALYRAGFRSAQTAMAPARADEQLAALLLYPRPEITVGIAVVPERFAAIRAANGNPPLSDVPPEQDAREFELRFPGEVSLDILTSREPSGSGAIARYLQKFHEGIQQVEFRCTDVERATALLRHRFHIAPVYPQKRPGAGRTYVNFFLLAADTGKVLLELFEKNPPAHTAHK